MAAPPIYLQYAVFETERKQRQSDLRKLSLGLYHEATIDDSIRRIQRLLFLGIGLITFPPGNRHRHTGVAAADYTDFAMVDTIKKPGHGGFFELWRGMTLLKINSLGSSSSSDRGCAETSLLVIPTC